LISGDQGVRRGVPQPLRGVAGSQERHLQADLRLCREKALSR